MSPKQVINTIAPRLSQCDLLSGIFLAQSGYLSDIQNKKETLETNYELRMYYLVTGKIIVENAGHIHTIQQHDVFFQSHNEKIAVTINTSTPVELCWIDLYGPALTTLVSELAISTKHPYIKGITDPRFYQELNALVTNYDSLSNSDKFNMSSSIYKIFAILLESSSTSNWTIVNHDDEKILYTGDWLAWPSPFSKSHDEYYTAEKKAYAEYNFYGTGVKWFGTLNFDCGMADVIIDGEYQSTVDTYSPVRLSKQLLYVNTKLKHGHHIIKIFCTGRKNDKATNCDIVVESFQYFQSNNSKKNERFMLKNVSILIQDAVKLIELNNNDISVAKLADTLKVSRSYLSTKFSNEMGKSPAQYLIDMRIEKSKELLSYTDLSISKIAANVGYEDVFYFSRLFKNKENITPTQYRKLHQQI